MTDTLDSSVEAVIALAKKMNKEYASAHGKAVYAGTEIDDGWDQLPDQISSATQQLDAVWSSTRSHSEHRHIRAVEETLGELHDSMSRVSSATTNYLTVEAAAKQQMDSGEQPNAVDLEMARSKLEKADQSLTLAASNLRNNVWNLSQDS
jgi:hypothetical protein